ncbi:MAG: hypothetical protein MHM6MM_009073 [Cercozoa sp. M6MM]
MVEQYRKDMERQYPYLEGRFSRTHVLQLLSDHLRPEPGFASQKWEHDRRVNLGERERILEFLYEVLWVEEAFRGEMYQSYYQMYKAGYEETANYKAQLDVCIDEIALRDARISFLENELRERDNQVQELERQVQDREDLTLELEDQMQELEAQLESVRRIVSK